MNKIILILGICLVSSSSFADNLGKTTYKIACSNCHAANVAKGMKAPEAFDKDAWNKRFAAAKIEAEKNPKEYKSAMDYLLYRVKIGKGLMYHYGLCKEANVPNKDCSDKALVQAINYMSQRP